VILRTTTLTTRIGTELHTDALTLASGRHGDTIRELLQQRGVLVVRGAFMTNEQQLAFSHSIGKVQP
jgi:alpha-ketoglutarate-dependent taurine dioxygenase